MRNPSGFTLSEALTGLVALVVLAAVATPLWHTHQLRTRRDDAVEALLAVQAAEDQYFGKHARYADESQLGTAKPAGLGLAPTSRRGFYQITLRNSADSLAYWASARVKPSGGATTDTRCVEMRIDQNGRRFALDSGGVDRSADCWSAN
jgi:type IV pilus assembly protein PilE